MVGGLTHANWRYVGVKNWREKNDLKFAPLPPETALHEAMLGRTSPPMLLAVLLSPAAAMSPARPLKLAKLDMRIALAQPTTDAATLRPQSRQGPSAAQRHLQTAASCTDHQDTGLTCSGVPCTCGQLASYCTHATYGTRIRTGCPLACDACDEACNDQTDTGFVSDSTGDAFSCAQLASLCSDATHGAGIQRVCPATCGVFQAHCPSPPLPPPAPPPFRPRQECLAPMDVVLVLDESGSMRGTEQEVRKPDPTLAAHANAPGRSAARASEPEGRPWLPRRGS